MMPLADLRPDYPGPLAGIEAGLAACNTRYLLVCPCDSPHIPADLGPRLWEAMRSQGSQACHASDPARRHYLHLLLRVDQAADLQGFLDAGGRAVRHWLADKQVAEAPFTADEMANLNEPDTQRGVCGA
jgi:molybdopterin-guanine dinucleotide biosynthesis protein A